MLSKEVIEKVIQLAKLKLTEEESEILGKQLLNIIDFVNQLNEVSVNQVEEVGYSIGGTPLREDIPEIPLHQEKALMNAPEKENGFFVVPKILEV